MVRTARCLLAATLMCLALSGASSAQQAKDNRAEVALQAAIKIETIDGDLKAAIEAYRKVVATYGGNRAVAARALLQIGRCHEELGQSAARASYEQLIRDYADQVDVVALARAQLNGLTGAVAIRPLVLGSAYNNPLALSPDGTKAAVLEFTRGQNLSVFDAATGKTTPITSFDWTTNWVGHAVWSNDGRRIAYTQRPFKLDGNVAELRVATLDGTSQTVFRNTADTGRNVVPYGWSPDGGTLLAVVDRTDKTSAMGFVAISSGTFTALRSFPQGASPEPRLSPDGRFIAYVDGPANLGDIHVLSADGRIDHPVVSQSGDDVQPRWSPDGRHLAYISRRNGASTLWAVAVKDGNAVGGPFKIKDAMEAAQLLEWTTRGMAYSRRERTFDIYTVAADPATLQPRGVAQQLPYARNGLNFRATWSPDGKQLAFIASDPGPLSSRRSVVVLPAAGGEAREYLIPNGSYQYANEPYDLRWFGDSRGLGFSGFGAVGHVAFRLTLATGEWKTDTVPGQMWTRLEWNDDGSAYFYARHGVGVSDPGIVERNFQDHSERVVYHAPEKNMAMRELTLGPDRRSLAFALNSNWVVVDTVTGEASTVTKAGPANPALAAPAFHGWAPDGRHLILGETRGGNRVLVLAPVRGGDERPLSFQQAQLGLPLSGAPDASEVITLRWSPDGSRVAIGLAAGRADFFIIENPVAAVAKTAAR